MKFGEVALEFEDETRQRVGIALHLLEEVLLQLHHLVEINKQRATLEEPCVLVETMPAVVLVVGLVVYLTHYLLDDILHGDESARTSELVHDDGDVHLVLLEIAQKVVYHLRLGHKESRTDERLPAEVGRLGEMRQEILDVKHALDMVLSALIDGYAGIVVLHDTLQHLGERRLELDVNHVHTRRHHLLAHLPTEAYDTLEHLGLCSNVLRVGELHGLLEVVHREGLDTVAAETVGEHLAAHQQAAEGIEQILKHGKYAAASPHERQSMLRTPHLRHYLAEEQKQEGEEHREYGELQPHSLSEIHHTAGGIAEKHDDGHVDQIVGDENRGKQALGALKPLLDTGIARMALFLHLLDILRRKGEKRYFTSADESRHKKQEKRARDSYNTIGIRGIKLNRRKGLQQSRDRVIHFLKGFGVNQVAAGSGDCD